MNFFDRLSSRQVRNISGDYLAKVAIWNLDRNREKYVFSGYSILYLDMDLPHEFIYGILDRLELSLLQLLHLQTVRHLIC